MKNKLLITVISTITAILALSLVNTVIKSVKNFDNKDEVSEETVSSSITTTLPETVPETVTDITASSETVSEKEESFPITSPETTIPEEYDIDAMLGFKATYGEYIEIEVENNILYVTSEMKTKDLEENLINLRDLVLSENFKNNYSEIDAIDYYAFNANAPELLMSCVVNRDSIAKIAEGKYSDIDDLLSDLENKNINI